MHPSAQTYTPLFLRLYDFFILYCSNTFVWRCSTSSELLPLFEQHIGAQFHLDVGAGTGFYPSSAARRFTSTKLTLLDLNPNTLQKAAARLRQAGCPADQVETTVHDVFEPLPAESKGHYDSVSMFYVFHCLPGDLKDKANRALEALSPALKSNGTLYGATVLGQGVEHNLTGRLLMKYYNKNGIFSNANDKLSDLQEALKQHFEDVDVRLVGTVALFVARTPRL